MATYLNYPFDPELFLLNWQNEPDPTLTALYDSGAVQANARIQGLIANGGDFYTIPYYSVLTGTVLNYDGATDITAVSPTGKSQNGIVYGRAAAWAENQFVRDYNSGADPMRQITSQTAKFWAKERQKILLSILKGVFGVTGNAGWTKHTLDICTTGGAGTASVTDANKVGASTAAELIQQAVGDNAGIFSVAVMHSAVALNLAKLEQLTFRTQTDANGMQRQLRIADWNGLTVIVDDGVPVEESTDSTGAMEYTTYLLGTGAIQRADAPVTMPVETSRDAMTDGGTNYLITRIRETMHPNGFSFKKPGSGYTASPTDAQLSAAANWAIIADPKTIAMAKLVSNG